MNYELLDRLCDCERDGGSSTAGPIEDGCAYCGTTDGPLTLIDGGISVMCDDCWEKWQLTKAA